MGHITPVNGISHAEDFMSTEIHHNEVPKPPTTPNKEEELRILQEIEIVSAYFKPIFKFFSYLLYIPYSIETDGKTYTSTTTLWRQVLCAFLHCLACIEAVFTVRDNTIGKVQNDPYLFLRLVDRVNAACYCFIFFYIVWFKKDDILKVLGVPIPAGNKMAKSISRSVNGFIFIFITTFSVFAYISAKLDNNWSDPDISKTIGNHTDKIIQEYYLSPFESHLKNSPMFKVIGVTSIICRLYVWLLLDSLMALCIIIGACSFRLAREFKLYIIQCQNNSSDTARIFEAYYKIKNLFNMFSELFGPVFVVVFVSLITFCAVSTADILDSTSWTLPCIMGIYFALFTSVLLFPAEAHYQASHFKTWLVARRKGSVSNMMDYLEVDSTNLAVKAGRLFTITYGFLGTASSVVLTYAIITIQFRGCCSAKDDMASKM